MGLKVNEEGPLLPEPERLYHGDLVTTCNDNVLYEVVALRQSAADPDLIWADLDPVVWPGEGWPGHLTWLTKYLTPITEMEALAIAASCDD
jgi:hypothetical protein